MTDRRGLAALYLTRDVGFATAAAGALQPRAASKSLGDRHTGSGKRGRAFWTWLEDFDQVYRPAAYAVWSRINDQTPDVGYEQLGLSFVAEMWADEIQLPIVRGDDSVVRNVLGANYPHHYAGIQCWARERGHDRNNAEAIYAALLWNWACSRLGKLVA